MKILLVNKFLYPKGGSETYVFKLGEALEKHGHKVQYFGMEDENRVVGNKVNQYTSNMDFHGNFSFSTLLYPIKTIYSSEARKKIRKVLDDFMPDVCHLNNFNYQLTPSIILEIVKWRKQTGKQCKIIFTAHDYHLICPNHSCYNPQTNSVCTLCLSGDYSNCFKNKCVHNSRIKSLLGTAEAYIWNLSKVYSHIDTIICCSEFLKELFDTNPLFAEKTVAIHNFMDNVETEKYNKKDYILYFGRYSQEKGIKTLLKVCKELPDVEFVFAGDGPLNDEINQISNIKNVGFKSGNELIKLVSEARFTIYPSEWYENCPYSVIESQMYGTPVLGACIGGIPELIEEGVTGELFESGNESDLKAKIILMLSDDKKTEKYSDNCKTSSYLSSTEYLDKISNIYFNL